MRRLLWLIALPLPAFLLHCVGADADVSSSPSHALPETTNPSGSSGGAGSSGGLATADGGDAGAPGLDTPVATLSNPCADTSDACPTSLHPADLQLWLRGDVGVDCTGGRIADWHDLSGKMHGPATIPAPGGHALTPQCGLRTIGTRPAISFTRPASTGGSFDDEVMNMDLSYLRAKPYTIFLVEQRASNVYPNVALSAPSTGTGGLLELCPSSGEPNRYFTMGYFAGADGGANYALESACTPVLTPMPVNGSGRQAANLIVMWFDQGLGRRISVNGADNVPIASGPTAAWDNSGALNGALGRGTVKSGATNFDDRYHGEIGELVIYDSLLTPAERAVIATGIKRRWNL